MKCLDNMGTFGAGSAITGPIEKECADLWPRIASATNVNRVL
jgi:ribosomal protein L14